MKDKNYTLFYYLSVDHQWTAQGNLFPSLLQGPGNLNKGLLSCLTDRTFTNVNITWSMLQV